MNSTSIGNPAVMDLTGGPRKSVKEIAAEIAAKSFQNSAKGGGSNQDADKPSDAQKEQKPVAPRIPITQPRRNNAQQVVFKSGRVTFNFHMPDNSRVSFRHGYLCTDDPAIIKYIKEQYVPHYVSVVEEGPFAQAQQAKK